MRFLKKKKINFVYLVLLVILLLRLLTGNLKDNIEVAFLDVGQGACVYASVNKNSCVMFDGGSSSNEDICEYIIMPFLRTRGINNIKYWFISHCDLDHVSGLIEFLSDYKMYHIKIDNIVLPKYRIYDDKYDEIIKYAFKNKINVKEISSGDKIILRDDYNHKFNINCLAPVKEDAYENGQIKYKDHNDESEVFYLKYGLFETLLMGDFPLKSDSYLIKELEKLNTNRDVVEVIQASHHGSKTGTSNKLLNQTNSKYCVISAGLNNMYHHPNQELINRLKKHNLGIFETSKYGNIIFKSDGKMLKINTMF